MIGVIAFSGNTPFVPGKTITRLHNKATQAPDKIVTGTSIL